MIHLKTDAQLEAMAKGGKILAQTLAKVMEMAKPGVTELALDAFAEKLIRESGGEPGFQKVPGYKHTICVSINDVVVHGVPTDYKLQKGDVFGVDCGVFYKGLHTDMSETKRIKNEKKDAVDLFIETGKDALTAGIAQAVIGNHVGDISKAIQDIVEGGGYSVVRSLVGHGVGRQLHEEPEVPGFLVGSIKKTPLLRHGMVIAIEAIYNMGGKDVIYAGQDGWTIKTADGSISGLFERTVAITKDGPRVLTR